MNQIARLASFYTPIRNEKDAERVLSDLSIFWYAFGIILIIILLIVTILTKEKVSLLFPIILLFTGYFLPRRKSRVLPSFILVYSLALNGVAIWFFSRSPITNFANGLGSMFENPLFIAKVLFFLLFSLTMAILALCSWLAVRSIIATFVHYKKIGSQIFWRNFLFACGFISVLPFFVPMPYAFSEIPWQNIKYVDSYKYFTEELFVYVVSALISIIFFVILTNYFPLVRWTNANSGNMKMRKILSSLYTPIKNKEDAETVLSDLAIFLYAFSAIFGIFGLADIISSKTAMASYVILGIFPLAYLIAGYLLPRNKSRVLSIITSVISTYAFVMAVWYFLYVKPPSFGLALVTIVPNLIYLLIPSLIILCTWATYRSTIATFIYHRNYSQLKKVSSSDKTSSLY